MMVNSDNNALLTPEKFLAHAQPKPSFNCQHATIASEKKIFSSFDLAAWDKSVNNAYKMMEAKFKRLERTDELAALKTSQRKWLAERNQCSSDHACLNEKRESRALDLIELAK